MPSSDGTTHRSEARHIIGQTSGPATSMWPMGRMVAVVSAICLAIWIVVIAYLLRI